MNRTLTRFALVATGATVFAFVLAIALGGPGQPAPMPSITQPFKTVDFHALPAVEHFADRHGAPLAFRRYLPATVTGVGSVVLIHGSSATGSSMHPMAEAFRDAGFAVYTLDMRGHGASGTRGRIDRVGQLEDDVEDFVHAINPAAPRTLVGFSSGGGFVLRFASDARQTLFDRYLLLVPFLSQDAPTQRPNSGGWVSVGMPRYIAIAVLNRVGIAAFNDLPVTQFSVDEADKARLTPAYSFALAENFRPRRDYMGDIHAMRQPVSVVVGQQDEAFHADRFAQVFAARTPAVPVTVFPNVGHLGLTLDPAALKAVVAALPPLQPREPN
jgi:non-heme chloroperoxidase